jgi:hypothetical protein
MEAHIQTMSKQQPTFVAQKNPGSGWGVDVLWPDGETEVIKGFVTNMTPWVAEHSEAWRKADRDRRTAR